MFGFAIGINVRVYCRFISWPHILPSSSPLGHQRCFSWLTASRRIRVFPICHCWRIRNANGSFMPSLSTGGNIAHRCFVQVAVFIGELIGHYLNDAIMHTTTRRNNGVFEAESRLWYALDCAPFSKKIWS